MSSANSRSSLLSRFSLRHPLLATGSRWRLRLIAVAAGVIVLIAVGVADWLMFDAGFSPFRIMLGSDGVAAVLMSFFVLKLLTVSHERRELVRRRLEIIGETNHHIRNALELIQWSAQSTHDQNAIDNIATAVDRIQWVLREMLGDGEEDLGLLKRDQETKP